MTTHTTNHELSSTYGTRKVRKLSERDYKKLSETDSSVVSKERYKRVLDSLDVVLRKLFGDEP